MAWAKKAPSGKWRGSYRGPDDRERSRSFEKKRDALRWAQEQERSVERSEWVDPGQGLITLSEWSAQWLRSLAHLKPKTLDGYASLLRSQIEPVFGHLQIRRIDQLRVKTWVAEMQRNGLSASRTRQAFNVLGSCLQSAVDAGRLSKSPCTNVSLPRLPKTEIVPLTVQQVSDLCKAVDPRYRIFLLTLAYSGLRLGEAVALQRSNCDLLRGRITVTQSMAEVGGKLIPGPPKTHQHRTVAIPDFLRRELELHLADNVGPSPTSLVFTSPEGGPIRQGNFRNRFWMNALAGAKLPQTVRIHDLRHTHASWLIAQGAHPKEVQAQLGHSSITVTMDRYGHLFPDALEPLASRLDAAFKEAENAAASLRPGHEQGLRQVR